VTGHIPSAVTLREAVEAGQDQINHIGFLIEALDPKQPGSFKSADELAQFLATHHTVVDPTEVIPEIRLRKVNLPLSDLVPGSKDVPTDVVVAHQTFRSPAEIEEKAKQFQQTLDLIRALHLHGVRFVAGSDQGLPGYSLIREVELYVDAGLSNADAIRAATVVPAEVMGLSKEVGLIEPGMRADILILDRDPLTDITALEATCAVMKSGRLYNSLPLRAAAGFTTTGRQPCL
jgi:hypothetical protein